MTKKLILAAVMATVLGGCSYSIQRNPSLGESPDAPKEKVWGFLFPHPQTMVTILNSSPCEVDIILVGSESSWKVRPMGGRVTVTVNGETGDEFLLQATASCDVYFDQTGEVASQFIGVDQMRLCGPFRTNRAASWVLSKDKFSLEPKDPAPCQAAEPGTYPYYPAGGWGYWGWNAPRGNSLFIGINTGR